MNILLHRGCMKRFKFFSIEFIVYLFNNPKWLNIVLLRQKSVVGSVDVSSILKIPLDVDSVKLWFNKNLISK